MSFVGQAAHKTVCFICQLAQNLYDSNELCFLNSLLYRYWPSRSENIMFGRNAKRVIFIHLITEACSTEGKYIVTRENMTLLAPWKHDILLIPVNICCIRWSKYAFCITELCKSFVKQDSDSLWKSTHYIAWKERKVIINYSITWLFKATIVDINRPCMREVRSWWGRGMQWTSWRICVVRRRRGGPGMESDLEQELKHTMNQSNSIIQNTWKIYIFYM